MRLLVRVSLRSNDSSAAIPDGEQTSHTISAVV